MKRIIDIDEKDYESINKTGITLDLNTAFHGKEKDKEMTFAIFNLVEALKNGTPYNPSGDLINYEDLKKALELEYNDALGLCSNEVLATIQNIIKLVDNAPRYEQEVYLDETSFNHYIEGYKDARRFFERPKGEWYYNYQNGWHCSICHESVKDMPTVMGKANFAFCPHCGADMQGDE